MSKSYTIPAHEVPVKFSADVVVCGGGTAGVHAAVAAANEGCSVILIEQFGFLSGTAGSGLVTPYMSTHIAGEPTCSYTSNLLTKKLLAMNGIDEKTKRTFDPIMMRFASEQLCREANVQVLFYHMISDVITENGNVKGVMVATKSGTYIIEGKEFIDCTGDGDVSVLAGAEYTKGNPDTGSCQPMSLRYMVSGVDINAFGESVKEELEKTGINRGASYSENNVYAACTLNGEWTFSNLFDKAIAAGDLLPEDKMYWQIFTLPMRPDTIAVNSPEFFEDIDGSDVMHLTRTQLEGKERIFRQFKFYQKYLKGFEKAYISDIAAQVGVRESRNITTKYVLKAVDLYAKRKFEDGICESNYPIDVHGKVLSCIENVTPADDGKPWYDIPFGSLVVAGFDNLFVAGRCLGCEFLAQASIRVQHSCRATGEAAGIGAAMAIKQNISSHDVDGKAVRGTMIAKGAYFK